MLATVYLALCSACLLIPGAPASPSLPCRRGGWAPKSNKLEVSKARRLSRVDQCIVAALSRIEEIDRAGQPRKRRLVHSLLSSHQLISFQSGRAGAAWQKDQLVTRSRDYASRRHPSKSGRGCWHAVQPRRVGVTVQHGKLERRRLDVTVSWRSRDFPRGSLVNPSGLLSG